MKINNFNLKYLDSFTNLIDKCFWISNKDKTWLIKWKFFSNINFKENKIICTYENNEIVAQYSNIAKEFLYRNKIFNWYLCQDMCVLKWFRWKGLISKMSKQLYSSIEEKTFTIWFSNKNWVKIDKNSKWYWYKVIENISSFFLLSFLKSNNSYSYEFVNNVSKLSKINFEKFNLFQDYLKINSSFEYIKWRYFDKPNSNYKFYLLKNGEKNIWYVIFRFYKWFWIIYDFNVKNNVELKILVNTFKNISNENKKYILKIQLLDNLFWQIIFSVFFKIILKDKIYLTIKNHNWFNYIDNLDKNNWVIMTWDIM
jgi:hypothetical protein